MSQRLGPETRAIIEAIHGTENMESRYHIGLWTFERMGKTSIYKVYITADPAAIAMTGAAVATQLHIPFAHKWIRIHFYHTDATIVAVSTAYLRITLRREVGKMFPANYLDELFCEFNINQHLIQEQYGEGFEYEACVWTLILNSVATDLIFPLFYVQKLEA